jgi:hypothetical protein
LKIVVLGSDCMGDRILVDPCDGVVHSYYHGDNRWVVGCVTYTDCYVGYLPR